MYIKSYRNCIHCNKSIVSTRHKDHQSKCLRMQEERANRPGKVGHPVGVPAWNKGLTKETSDAVARHAKAVSDTLQTKVKNGTYRINRMGESARLKLSEEQSIKNRGGKCKWFDVNGIKVQGTWEYNIALKLNEMGIDWSKPKTNTDLIKYVLNGKIRSYSPDFYLSGFNVYLEIKGYWWGYDKQKMEAVMEQHPDKKIVIVEKAEYKRILQGELVWS